MGHPSNVSRYVNLMPNIKGCPFFLYANVLTDRLRPIKKLSMLKLLRTAAITLLALLPFQAAVQAQTIHFDNLAINAGAGGGQSDLATGSSVLGTSIAGTLQGKVISSLAWHGFYANNVPGTDDFAMTIWVQSPGFRPNYPSLLTIDLTNITRTATGVATFGKNLYLYEANFAPTLIPNNSPPPSILSIYNDTSNDGVANNTWSWHSNTIAGGPEAYSMNTTATSGFGPFPSSTFDRDMSIRITAVPEPATYASFAALTAFALVFVRRRRNNSRRP